jgi:hypothetical protein
MTLIEGFPEIANLDDKTFDDLIKEARARLARYGNDWTDHNISDPGITFIELFAWLAEMQIYQLNRVTDASYDKFLKLVGIHPLEAQPARVNITFEDVINDQLPLINARQKIFTKIGTEKFVFETDETLSLTTAEIISIITTCDYITIDNTKANEKENIYFAAFGEKASIGATLKIGLANIKKMIKITFVLAEDDLKPVGSHGDEPPLVSTSAKVVWEYKSDGNWKELPIEKDNTMNLTRNGSIVFNTPSDIKNDKGLCWIRCQLKEGKYEIAPHVNRILLNTVSAVQIETKSVSLEKGKGTPDQIVQLPDAPFINRILFIVTDILEWSGLFKQFKKKIDVVNLSPEKRIFGMLDPTTQTRIIDWKGDKEPEDFLKYAIVESFNKILESRDLYDFDSFKGIKNDIANDETSHLPRKFFMFLFNWDELIENDNKKFIEFSKKDKLRFMEFLIKNYNLDWIQNALIKKITDKTVEIFYEKNSFSLQFNNENKVDLIINDEKKEQFFGKNDNYKHNIYYFAKKINFTSDHEVRILNRFLIEAVFREIIEKNRLLIEVKRSNIEYEYWYEVDDFESSGPDDTHYRFDREKNEIIFGNGLNGRIPTESEEIRAIYKTTLGQRGNIPKRQKFEIKNIGFTGIFGKNHIAATGGKAAETLDDVKKRARKDCRVVYRAITSEDYEYLALNTPGLRVARAKALPNYNHDFPAFKLPDVVTVIVVPYMREKNINPVRGEGFLKTVLRHLNQHRLITTNVNVIGPEYVKITINCKIHVEKRKDPTRVKKDVCEKLDDYLDPLRGGPDGKGWGFGRAVFSSEIYKLIDEVDGVDYATNLSFVDEKGQYHKDVIKISPISLVYPGEHKLQIMEV